MAYRTTRDCVVDSCGKTFVAKNPRALYCSPECQRIAFKQRRAVRYTLTCDYCQKVFTRAKPRIHAKAFCSAECTRKGQTYVPGVPFSVSGPYGETHTCGNPKCAAEFVPHHPSVIYCSNSCRLAASVLRSASRYAAAGMGETPKEITYFYAKQRKRESKALLLETQPACAICGRDFEELDIRQVHLDHDHKNGTTRELLCFSCNAGLGHFKDNIETIKAALRYLEKHASDQSLTQ